MLDCIAIRTKLDCIAIRTKLIPRICELSTSEKIEQKGMIFDHDFCYSFHLPPK